MKALDRVFRLSPEHGTKIAMIVVNQITSYLGDVAAVSKDPEHSKLAHKRLQEMSDHIDDIRTDLRNLRVLSSNEQPARLVYPRSEASAVKACTFD